MAIPGDGQAPVHQTLGSVLAQLATPGKLDEELPDNWVGCYACGHRCNVPPGRAGICRVRFNDQGVLRVPTGHVGALQCDPVEKKPFFHALPGALALSFGMLRCDLHCAYCRTFVTSQALRDLVSDTLARPTVVAGERLVQEALRLRAPIIASTYRACGAIREYLLPVVSHLGHRTQGLHGPAKRHPQWHLP